MDPEPFDPRVFEEFLRKREVEEMEARGFLYPMHEHMFAEDEHLFTGNEHLFAGNDQPFDTIDLTGDDDLETD